MSAWAGQVFARRLRDGHVDRLTGVVEELVAAGGDKLGWGSALGVVRFDAGDVDAARAIYRSELGGDATALPRGMFRLTHTAMLSELAMRLEDAAGAEALYGQLLQHREQNVVVAYCSFWGPVEGILGRLAETFGDAAAARSHLERALTRTRAIPAPVLTHDLDRRFLRLAARA
jgi:hypothetical protein